MTSKYQHSKDDLLKMHIIVTFIILNVLIAMLQPNEGVVFIDFFSWWLIFIFPLQSRVHLDRAYTSLDEYWADLGFSICDNSKNGFISNEFLQEIRNEWWVLYKGIENLYVLQLYL